jgi:hypothetical protein
MQTHLLGTALHKFHQIWKQYITVAITESFNIVSYDTGIVMDDETFHTGLIVLM